MILEVAQVAQLKNSLILFTLTLFGLVFVLTGCISYPARTVENRIDPPKLNAFHWKVSWQEAKNAQIEFPFLGGVLFGAEYANARYLDTWIAIYDYKPDKLWATIQFYGKPAYIMLGVDEPNTDHHTRYYSPIAFAEQMNLAAEQIQALGFDDIPLVSAGLAPINNDFDWVYWTEVEKHIDSELLSAVTFNANKTPIDKIEYFISYFESQAKQVVLQPAPFNNWIHRETSGSERLETFFQFSQRPEVLSVNVWTLVEKDQPESKGFISELGELLHVGDAAKNYYKQNAQGDF